MTDPKAALRDWSCKPKPPSNSGSILTRCLICFCPSNAPYVGGFVLIKAFLANMVTRFISTPYLPIFYKRLSPP
jgi:hypothetical protein